MDSAHTDVRVSYDLLGDGEPMVGKLGEEF